MPFISIPFFRLSENALQMQENSLIYIISGIEWNM